MIPDQRTSDKLRDAEKRGGKETLLTARPGRKTVRQTVSVRICSRVFPEAWSEPG